MSDLNLEGMTKAQLRLFAVRCARRVQHLMTDPRSLAALDVAERYARGEATDEELVAARVAANAAWAAMDAVAEASGVSPAAWAARATAWNAADAVWAAAAAEASRAAVRAAEHAEQQKILEEIRGSS